MSSISAENLDTKLQVLRVPKTFQVTVYNRECTLFKSVNLITIIRIIIRCIFLSFSLVETSASDSGFATNNILLMRNCVHFEKNGSLFSRVVGEYLICLLY